MKTRFKQDSGVSAYDAGRRAFWHGRGPWANVGIATTAGDWRAGYRAGESELRSKSDAPVTPELLAQHRPSDVPKAVSKASSWKRSTQGGAGTKAAKRHGTLNW